MKYLGIDYGKTKIGLAVSEGQVASVLRVMEIGGLKDALQKVEKIIKDEEADRVVVGLPESGEARSITKKFLIEIKSKLKDQPVEVIETEETLSSFQARALMHDLDLSEKAVKVKEDEYAAAIILQTFLDSLQ
jgi:putative holliday junction resolvase